MDQVGLCMDVSLGEGMPPWGGGVTRYVDLFAFGAGAMYSHGQQYSP